MGTKSVEVVSQEKLEFSQPKTGLAGPIQNGESKRCHTTTDQRDQKENRQMPGLRQRLRG